MKLNPLHLRIAILILNFAAAVAVPAYARMSYLKARDGAGTIAIANPADLEFREGDTAAMVGRGPSQLVVVADWLMPKAPAPEAAGSSDPVPEVSTVPRPPEDPEELPPGPLAEQPHNLEFVSGIFVPASPTKSLVILRRKDPSTVGPGGLGAGAPGSARTAVRRTPTVPQRPARVTVGRKALGGPPSEQISFTIGKRRYVDEEQGLDFMIHAVDDAKFIYWMPDDPRRMYALQKVTDSKYYTNREAGLRPPEKSPEELAVEEEKKTYFIKHERRDIEDGREEEYREMLGGGAGRGAILFPEKSSGAGRGKAAPAATPAPSSPRASTGKTVPRFGRTDSAEQRAVMTQDEREQLQEVLRSPKMSEKEREEVRKTFTGGSRVK